MKKNLLNISAAIVLLSLFIIPGCKKDDTVPPVISLNGSASVTISLNSSYSDAGATANDDEDGSINVTSDASNTNPDVNTAGTYTITYTATDAAGNASTETRTVIVRNDAYYLEGTYLCSEDNFTTTWTQTITADAHYNNRIVFEKFAKYGYNNSAQAMSPKIYAQVTGTLVALPTSQNASGGVSGCTHTFTQNGTSTVPIALVSGKYNFSVSFFDDQLPGGSGCNDLVPVPYEDVCHQL